MNINQFFKKVTNFYPYEFQLESIDLLLKGRSLILMAPTGSGKSEVAFISFLLGKNNALPSQMIYSLPTRTLIENLSRRAQKYASFKNFSTAFHHGRRIESELFDEDIILTTIDQTIGAYACTPLSAPTKRGNILAGAVSSAFLVFDEIHTFDPDRALQTTMILVEHSSKIGMPFTIMSATLPDSLIKKIKRITGKQTKIIKVEDESKIKTRKNREVILHTKYLKEGRKLSAEDILRIYESVEDKKLIVVCNNVEKAQQIYKEISIKKEMDTLTILIHSRFLDEDRKEKEEQLLKLFSKKNKKGAILISTQVIEVGMDISSNAMITEIAHIDSLIQRAGRCARWGGKGDFYIFDVENYQPYIKDLVEKTKEELEKYDGEVLTWDLEEKLVNEILSNYYKKVVSDIKRAEITGMLTRAILVGDKTKIEECVRNAYTCNVSIHDNPQQLCNENNDILRLQKVKVNVWVFRSRVKKLLENGVKIWSIEESNIVDDYTFRFAPSPIVDPETQILPYKHYVVAREGAKYSKDTGLEFGVSTSENFDLTEKVILEKKEMDFLKKYEPWVDHANTTLEVLDNFFIPRYNFAIDKFSTAFQVEKKDFVEKIRIAVALHDLGKLHKDWQNKIGWDGNLPLAHSDKVDVSKVGIPHATVSAVCLNRILVEGIINEDLWLSFVLAIAHHHTPRAREYPKFVLIKNFQNILDEVDVNVDTQKIISQASNGVVPKSIIDISIKHKFYRFYSFLSKILRLSDWIATAGGGYESIFYN